MPHLKRRPGFPLRVRAAKQPPPHQTMERRLFPCVDQLIAVSSTAIVLNAPWMIMPGMTDPVRS